MDLGSLPCACGLAVRPRRPFGITKSTAEAPRSGAGLLAQRAGGPSAGPAPATLRPRGPSLIQGAAAGRVSKGGNTQSARSHPSRRALRALLRMRSLACDDSNCTGKTLGGLHLESCCRVAALEARGDEEVAVPRPVRGPDGH